MNAQTYAVFLDIDDTLMHHRQIHQKNIDAITAVRQKGHQVFINTGRSYAAIPGFILETICFDGIVAGIGSYVRYKNDVIRNVTIPPDLLSDLTDYFLTAGIPCFFEGDTEVFRMNLEETFDDIPMRIIDRNHNFTSTYKDARITKLTPVNRLSATDVNFLDKHFTVIEHDSYAEIAMKGCSKSNGMFLLLDYLGHDRKNSIAIGDSTNDLDMLQAAGISIAMANAAADIKAVCDYVTDYVDSAGVALALERYLL